MRGLDLGSLKAVKGGGVGVVHVLRVMADSEHLPALLVEGRREVGRLELRVTSRGSCWEAWSHGGDPSQPLLHQRL